MGEPSREAELKVGRRSQDGRVRLAANMPQLLTLSVTYGAERSSTVMLTLEQVRELQRVLARMEQLLEQEQAQVDRWDGSERRRPAA